MIGGRTGRTAAGFGAWLLRLLLVCSLLALTPVPRPVPVRAPSGVAAPVAMPATTAAYVRLRPRSAKPSPAVLRRSASPRPVLRASAPPVRAGPRAPGIAPYLSHRALLC